MKKLLTIIDCKKFYGEEMRVHEDIEFMYTDGEHDCTEIIKYGVKQSKSKYICLTDGAPEFAEIKKFIAAASSSDADIIVFEGGYCFKAQLIKPRESRFLAEIAAATDAKSILKLDFVPFTYNKDREEYSKEAQEALLSVLQGFDKNKAKLAKEVYTFAFELICRRLVEFYISAMLAGATESLVEFDANLKRNVILYLALEKRFPVESLSKLREKQFKISSGTAKKFLKYYN